MTQDTTDARLSQAPPMAMGVRRLGFLILANNGPWK
jgi:hypothetical protein